MQTILIITGIAITAFILLNIITKARMRKKPLPVDNTNILNLSDANFKHQLKDKTVLVDFWASWCAPCRMMAPILNELADELTGNNKIGKVNIESYQSLATEYKIRSIPTMVLYKNGIEVSRYVGIKSKDFLLKEILKY